MKRIFMGIFLMLCTTNLFSQDCFLDSITVIPPPQFAPPPSGVNASCFNDDVNSGATDALYTIPEVLHKTVNVEIHVMQKTNGTGNFTNTTQHINFLNQVLGLMNWYTTVNAAPLWGGPTGDPYHPNIRIRFENKGIFFHQDDLGWSNNGSNCGNYNYTNYGDQTGKVINIFVAGTFSPTYGSTGGCGPAYFGPGNSSILLFNIYNNWLLYPPGVPNPNGGQPWADATLLYHEMGHALGLLHTFVHSTYLRHLDTYWPHNRNCDPYTATNCANNVMSYVNPQNFLSNKQIGHMHKLLTTGWRKNVTPKCETNVTDIVNITGNVVWNMPQLVNDIVRVKPNATLTISCYAQFSPGSRLIVEPGGKLIVDGALLTSSCDDTFWNGIEVWGNSGQSQTSLANQGLVELKNGATIEYAREGIAVMEPGNWSSFGGIVRAEESTFKDCKRAVAFMSYSFHNTSYFKKCKFEVTTDYIPFYNSEPNGPFSQVTLWDNKGVTFLGCEFVDNSGINEFDEFLRNGIFSIDAGYSVLSLCDMAFPTFPCPQANILRSSFKNFNNGIKAFGTSTTNTIVVDATDFEDNTRALQIEALDQVRFTNNTVKIGGLLKSNYTGTNTGYQFGLFSFESSGYQIEENNFQETGSVMPTSGINIIESGQDPNQVYRNTFTSLDRGQMLDGLNRNGNIEGLEILCNTNNNPGAVDIEVNDINGQIIFPDGIKRDQGINITGAGNVFTSNATRQIDNKTNPVIRYHDVSNLLPQVSKVFGPVSLITVNNTSSCVSNFSPIGPGGLIPLAANAHADYYNLRTQYNGLLYNYHSVIDNGNTDSVINAINLTFSNAAQQLRDDLMAEAPYLSEEALRSAAETGILTDALLLEVCLANPEATMSEGFLDFVEFEIPNPLPSQMVQLIYQNWDVETPRTLLEYQIAELSNDLAFKANNILRHYMTDTLDHADSIKSLIDSRKRIHGKYRLAEIAIEAKNWTECFNTLTQISNNHTLEGRQLDEHNNFVAYAEFREELDNAGRSIMELEETEKISLRSLADAGAGRSSVMARNILCFGYQECNVGGEPEERRKARRVYNFNKNLGNQELNSNFSVRPNPVNELMNVSIQNRETDAVYLLRVFSLEGKLVMEQSLVNNQNTVNMSKLEAGIYLVEIYLGEERQYQDKLIVNH